MILLNGVCDQRKLDSPWRTPGERKKFSVCTKGPSGKPVLVRFGDPNMEIKRDNPKNRKNFRSRHGCDNPGPKWKPKFWSCKTWEKGKTVSQVVNTKYPMIIRSGVLRVMTTSVGSSFVSSVLRESRHG